MNCRRPDALDAEQQVLGAIMLSPDALERVRGLLPDASAFSHPRHRVVYHAALTLADRGCAIDPVTLADVIDPSALAGIGGIEALIALDQLAATAVNVEHHAELVHAAAQRRRATDVLRRGIAALADADDWSSAAEQVQAELTALDAATPRADATLAEAIAESLAAAQAAANRGFAGLSTGLPDLDRLLGGLEPGHLVVLAGRPGMGKTALGLDIAARVAATGGLTAVDSLEMPRRELGARFVCNAARVDTDRYRSGQLSRDEIDRILTASRDLESLPLHIDDTPSASIAQIQAFCARTRRDGALALLVIDYLQLMSGDGRSREEEVARNSRALKAMAKRLGVPILLLAQLNRECERRTDKRPQLADLRESGAVEQDADAVVLLYRPDYYDPDCVHPGVAEAIVAKNRHGPTGVARLRFFPAWSRFESLAE